MTGRLITFEGVEGAGKSTQIRLLRQRFEQTGVQVVEMREPGGAPIPEAIRAILLERAHYNMHPAAELLLYAAARAQLVHERIRPALEAGAVVLCDRFADSTTAYQGAGRALAMDDIRHLHRIATQGIWPDLTFVLDLPVEEGLARVRGRGEADRMESESLAFHQRVRQGFLDIAAAEPKRVIIVDATQPPETLAADIWNFVLRPTCPTSPTGPTGPTE